MRKRLHLALMASPIIATFLSPTLQPTQATDDRFSSQRLTAVTDDGGRRVPVSRITALFNGGSSSDFDFTGASHAPVRVQRDERGLLYLSNTDSHRRLIPGRRPSVSISMAGTEQCSSGRKPEWKQNGESPA